MNPIPLPQANPTASTYTRMAIPPPAFHSLRAIIPRTRMRRTPAPPAPPAPAAPAPPSYEARAFPIELAYMS